MGILGSWSRWRERPDLPGGEQGGSHQQEKRERTGKYMLERSNEALCTSLFAPTREKDG